MTGLHLAAMGGHLHTVKSLLQRGAPLELRNVWGGTVLNNVLWAAVHYDPNVDYSSIVEALIEAGSKIEPEVPDWWQQQEPLLPSSKPRIAELLR